ncbi:LOW QUALITY PROTEIN: uncharacterized protein LOC110422165 [Herrania umbratica]|uniref:LOW QUALITY PROTEIN: uncharacterized protein LOC110422165 n=1 Tax=Herrania umbratica TaxID=108875 RepID=A0A6J1AX94_9ROSI|nr:LOW QUALITY PROTEIN: uncharacterized protein LOC110422165 [Herrania umbratica]
MDELRQIAKAYYELAPKNIQKEAQKFFNEIDFNGDRPFIALEEFLEFMKQKPYSAYRSSNLFKELCRGNGANKLGFMDVMTLYYIVQSGRPFCNGCDEFIKDVYFCCMECFHSSTKYCLCLQCYKAKKYRNHPHRQFLDNFTLREANRRNALNGVKFPNQGSSLRMYDAEDDGESSGAIVAVGAAIVLYKDKEKKREKMKAALRRFQKALHAGGAVDAIPKCNIQ